MFNKDSVTALPTQMKTFVQERTKKIPTRDELLSNGKERLVALRVYVQRVAVVVLVYLIGITQTLFTKVAENPKVNELHGRAEPALEKVRPTATKAVNFAKGLAAEVEPTVRNIDTKYFGQFFVEIYDSVQKQAFPEEE